MPSTEMNFDAVPLGTDEENACTPKEPEDITWTGILIQAPSQLVLAEGARLPLCGRLQLAATDGGAMKVVALLEGEEEPLEGAVFEASEDLEDAPPPGPPLDPELLEGLLVGGIFNHDAFAFVPKMATAGTWVVWVQVGDLSSNQVTVELTGGGG